MGIRWWRALYSGLSCLVFASPLSAQVGVVIHGRVEDAVSREPVARVLPSPPDSSFAVYTDSLGIFHILVPAEGPLAIKAERFGYVSQEFDFEGGALQIPVLLLEPSPIEMEGVTVVDEGGYNFGVTRSPTSVR